MAPPFITPIQAGRMAVMALILALVTGCGGGGGGDTGSSTSDVGDSSNFYPLNVGDRWVYKKTHTGQTDTFKLEEVTAVSTAQGKTIYTIRGADANSGAVEDTALEYKTAQGVYHTFTPPENYLGEAQLQLLQFPLTSGSTFTSVNKIGYKIDDLDGDGKPELLDEKVDILVEGQENITVPAGTFANTTRVRTLKTDAIHLSRSDSIVKSTITYTDWYYPGLGRVRNLESGKFADSSYDYTDELTLISYSVNGNSGASSQIKLTSTTPDNQSTIKSDTWQGTLSMTFDSPIDIQSLDGNITLSDSQGRTFPVMKLIGPNASTIEFKPFDTLKPGHYTVTLSPTIKDAGGKFITPPLPWSFFIVSPPKPVVFGNTITTTPSGSPSAVAISAIGVNGKNSLITVSEHTPFDNSTTTRLLIYPPTNGDISANDPFVVQFPEDPSCRVHATQLLAADITGDGSPEIMAIDTGCQLLHIFAKDPIGKWSQTSTMPWTTSGPTRLIDLNQDGRLDLVTADGPSHALSIWRQRPGGGLENSITIKLPFSVTNPSRPEFYDMAIGDVTGDGRPDIILLDSTGSSTQAIILLTQRTDGTFSDQPEYISIPMPYMGSVAIGDINSDGRLDVVITSGLYIYYALQDNSGHLQAARQLPSQTGTTIQKISIIDMNMDGRPDIVALRSGVASVSIFLQAADGSMMPEQEVATFNQNVDSIAFGDLNSDSFIDMATTGSFLSFMTMYQTATPSASPQYAPPVRRTNNRFFSQRGPTSLLY